MEDISKYFKEENVDKTCRNQPQIKYSPDKAYRLEIFYYKIGTPEDHYWDFTRGFVYNNATGELLLDVQRNYSSFYSTFLSHNNGNDYMICGRDYHGGYSILDLSNKKEYCYEPEQISPYEQFFCWADPCYNDFDNTLLVYGSYWACPFEIVTYDFSDPTSLPLREISRCYLNEEEE